jgi:NADH-quinone oxidoreductase subunit C
MTETTPEASTEPAAPEAESRVPEPYAAMLALHPQAAFDISTGGQVVVTVPPEDLVGFVRSAKEAGFDMFIDVTAVDYLDRRSGPRFDVVVGLLSTVHNRRIRILVPNDGEVPTITGFYPGANFFEREAYDLLGIVFTGHPDLTRILLPDDWEGHPLRRDYPVGSVPVQFRDTHKVE